MDEKLRESGIDIIGEVPWGTHICQFYDTKEDLTDILIPYFKAGLENNEFCMWVTSQPLGVEEAKEALRRAVPDLDVYMEKGQIEIIPYTDWYVKEGIFDSDRVLNEWVEKLNQALVNGYDGLRLTGNISWLEEKDWNNFANYEEEIDRIIGNYQMIALCTYCLDRCNAKEIIDVVVNHQFSLIKKDGKWEKVESSKRKQAEEAAIQATKDWEHTFDAVPDPIAILDNKYRIVRVNRAMAARLGVTPEECVGVICYRAIHGTDKPPSSCPHRQLLKDKLEHIKEVREDNLGGDFIVSVSPLFNSEGKLTECIHVARDINKRKQAEEALKKAHESLEEKVKDRTSELERAYNSLKESEERLAKAQRMAHIGNWDWNIVTNDLYWSDEVYRIFGRNPHELVPSYNEYLTYIHPDDRDYYCNAIKNVVNENPFDIDYRIVLANGEERTVHLKSEFICNDVNIPIRIKGVVQDITERKKAEEKIQSLANIVESSIDAIGTMSLDGIITSWNKGAEQVYGYSTEEILGKPISTLAPPHLDKETIKLIEIIKQGDKAHQYETSRLRKDGKTINVSITLSPVFDMHGKLTDVSFISRDITERKISEKKLRESEEKYRNIVETANEGIAVLNIEGKHTYVNKKMSDMLGYSEKELSGKFVKDLVKDANFFKTKFEERSRGVSESYEIKLIRKDGSLLWAFVNTKALFDTNGRFIGSLSMITNITERKLLEEHTRQRIEELTKVLDVAPVAIFIGHDPKSHNITGNRTAYELFETEVGENISASTTSMRRFFCKGRELTAEELPMQKVSLKNIDVRNVEFDMLLSSGKYRSLLGSASPLHDADMQVRGSVGVFMDITERKQAEEALRNFEIVRHQEIHHRIKNNLQVISSLLDLQAEIFKGRKNISDSEVQNAFKESMDRVISIALIHEELYKGKNTDVINFSQYIKVLAESLLLTYRLDIEVNLDFDLEENLFLDMDTAIPLGIIINEIVSNSFKYAFSGRDKGEIRIKLFRKENGECKNEGFKSTTFILSISDNGIGISKDLDIENLGSLGLQLVTALVDQLDGELELKRDNDTEFTIRFTVTETENQIAEPAQQQLVE